MARFLSNIFLKGMSSSPNSGRVALGSNLMRYMNYSSKGGGEARVHEDIPTNGFPTSATYSTKLTNDPDTHEDFQPTSKSSGMTLLDVVQQDVKENPVMIYMKGLPDAPRCGFSALAVKVLQQYGVPIRARDILGDLKLKESVKAYTRRWKLQVAAVVFARPLVPVLRVLGFCQTNTKLKFRPVRTETLNNSIISPALSKTLS